MSGTLFRLNCAAQNYSWGKLGLDSSVAQLLHSANTTTIDENKPYAELWMGTHVNGPSKVIVDGKEILLAELLSQNPRLLSTAPDSDPDASTGNLAYLFKILSANQALSIQAHPDKVLAKQLHKNFPDLYKDDNHKPEMALAITHFEALVGFQPLSNIVSNIKKTPELQQLVHQSYEGLNAFDSDEEKLKALFVELMHCDPKVVENKVNHLEKRLLIKYNNSKENQSGDDLLDVNDSESENGSKGNVNIEMADKLALRLAKEFPGDVGVFCVYFLAYKSLKPGEAVFLGANDPHAYISGDCAEIMATSDNVVRAGLTPKLRDVDTLCNMLNYVPFQQNVNLLKGTKVDQFTKQYVPPDPNVNEFQLEKIVLNSVKEYKFRISTYGSILLVFNGCGKFVAKNKDNIHQSKDKSKSSKEDIVASKGVVLFLGAGSSLSVTKQISAKAIHSSSKSGHTESDDLVIFRATKKNCLLSH